MSFAVPALADDAGVEGAEETVVTADDAVVAEVVRMLDGGVSASIVEAWLASGERSFGPLSANDLLALTQVEAPEALTRWLLEHAAAPTGPGAPTGPAAPATSSPPSPSKEPHVAPPAPRPAAPAAPVTPPSTASPSTPLPSPPEMGGPMATVEFRVRYSPLPDEDATTPRLFVYLAGQILTSVDSTGLLDRRGLVFRHQVPAGRHEVRVLAELHEPRRGDEWSHESRVLEQLLILDVLPGAPWIAELELSEPRFSLEGGATLEWRVFRGTEVRGEEEANVPLLSSWPYLCEDVRATYGDDEGNIPRSQRSKLTGCKGWSTLWTGTPSAASREEVRGLMARYDFRPVPADS